MDEFVTEMIEVEKIFDDSDFNCRGAVNTFDVIDLAKDIQERGLLQPIVVTPVTDIDGYTHRVLAGFRRLAAFRSLNKIKIPCVIRTHLTKLDCATINLMENFQRKDLNIMQEAKGLQNLIEAGLNKKEIVDHLGVSVNWVQARLALLDLPEPIQKEAAAGILKATHIMEIAAAKSPDRQISIMKEIRTAFERGEKREKQVVAKSKETESKTKKVRNQTELFKLQDAIRETIGNCLATRVIAWAAGEIDDYVVHKALAEAANRAGTYYQIPPEIVPTDED